MIEQTNTSRVKDFGGESTNMIRTFLRNFPMLKIMKNTFAIAILILLTYVPLKMGGDVSMADKEYGLPSKRAEVAWVNTMYDSMTEEERLGQLIVVRAYSNKDEGHARTVENLITKYHVGGMTFFQGTPDKQAELTNRYQKLATKVPLMISIDAEWGLGMRMKETTMSFPRQLTLGAIQDNRLVYEFGAEMARQCRRIGVHVNFAPVVDVNNNPNNPVINDRSFGEDRYNVAAKSYMYMKGMQDNMLMACAKHFPGHGDTDVDSHYDLPIINHNLARLDSIELYPFKVLSQHGVGSMMIAHLNIPAYDDRSKMPSSLSHNIVTDLLRNDLGYRGLIFTDGLEMAGARKAYKGGEVEVQALIAGNDVLLLPQSVADATKSIKKALDEGRLDKDEFEIKVKKVLAAKYRLGLTSPQEIDLNNIRENLNDYTAKALNRKLIENAMTAVRNKDGVLPLGTMGNYGSISIGRGYRTDFQKSLDLFTKMSHYHTNNDVGSSERSSLVSNLKDKDAVIISFQDLNKSAKSRYGIRSSALSLIKDLQKHTKVIVVVFGSPYALEQFDDVDWLIEAYEENDVTQEVAAGSIFGATRMTGRLPVTASRYAKFGDGTNTASVEIMNEVAPEKLGFDASKLAEIDKIAEEAIRIGATPSIQVLVARNGKIAYQKAYGYHTYDKNEPAQKDDIYDLASVTKICATTISMMKLVEDGKVDLDETIGTYIPEVRGTNKEKLIVRDVMAHHAGLKAWIPFYKATLVQNRPSSSLYSTTEKEGFSIPITDHWYLKDNYVDEIWDQIIKSPISGSKSYRYSDLGFYICAKIVENVSGQTLDQYVSETFYQPLGLQTAGFNPLNRFETYRIPPTEEDKYYRMEKVQGYVHDMGAAMLGGVSGHAGLFSDAKDVAIIMQMLMNGGNYAGKQYLKPETVDQFTTRYKGSTRRGLGFDMKEMSSKRSQNVSKLASNNTFGHLGFTGICTWADPDNDLVYIFLSNRTYPTMNNNKLHKLNFRPRIQTAIYEALIK
jgi:beta-glucosidase-like glycosyl hydrolase/CubicO group peptidase (beta-lactamase class C family)